MWTVIIIMGVLLLGYFIGQSLSNEYVICVEAGPVEGTSAEALRHKSFYAPRLNLVKDGKALSGKDIIRVVVSGDCMRPRNIVDGTQLYVQKISKTADVREKLHEGDILMLYLSDSKKYKIRELKGFTPEGAFLTFYYNADNTKHDSREPHRRETLVGVVMYRI